MTASQSQQPNEPLTDREQEIAWLVSFALTDREIAARLFIAIDTVKTHINNIRAKLGVPNRTAICRWVLVKKYENNIHLFSDVL
jgi:DNA-binding CsgD family transcriptional regulator